MKKVTYTLYKWKQSTIKILFLYERQIYVLEFIKNVVQM